MTFQLPEWASAEPGAPVPVAPPDGSGGRVVALVATEGAVSQGWVGELTVALAREWSGAGARLVVADGGLTHPTLHEALGLSLGEGLSDALQFGASVKRVAHQPDEGRFFAVTAGTAVADGAAVMAGPRWSALCEGFQEAGVTLAVLVPGNDPCLDGVLAQASEAVVFALDQSDAEALAEEWDVPVRSVVGRSLAEEPAQAVPEVEPEEDAAEEEGAFGDPMVFLGEIDPSVSAAPEAPDFQPGLDVGFEADAEDEATFGSEADPAFEATAEFEGGFEEEATPESEGVFEAGLDAGFDDGFEAQEVPGGLAEDDASAPDEGEPKWEVVEDVPEAGEVEVSVPEDVPDELEDQWVDPLEGALPQGDPLMDATSREGDEDLILEGAPADAGAPATSDELGGTPVPTFEEIVEDAESGPAPAKPRSRVGVLLVFLLLVVVAVAVAAWLGYVQIPGITPRGTAAAEASEAEAPVATMAAPPPAEVVEPLPFSVALGSYQDGATAEAMVSGLTEQVPGVLFITVPVTVDGTLVHRVLAGPAADSAGAVQLAESVAATAGLDPSGWVARWTPLAFQLGEMPERSAAQRRAGVLEELGVPAYVLAVPYADGSVRFRVYAGAYADASEASYLSGLLDERGLSSASLSDRTGRLPE